MPIPPIGKNFTKNNVQNTFQKSIKTKNVIQNNIDLSGINYKDDIMSTNNSSIRQSAAKNFLHKLFPFKRTFDPILTSAKQKFPKETQELLKETKYGYEGGERKLTAYEISQLAPVMKENHDEIKILLKEQKINWIGNKEGYSAKEIAELAPLMHKEPEIVKTLLKKTERSIYSRTATRFSTKEIIQLTPVMKKYPQEVKKLINGIRISIDTVRDFKTDEIIGLAPILKKYPKETEGLLIETKSISPEGLPTWNYTVQNVINKINSIK